MLVFRIDSTCGFTRLILLLWEGEGPGGGGGRGGGGGEKRVEGMVCYRFDADYFWIPEGISCDTLFG